MTPTVLECASVGRCERPTPTTSGDHGMSATPDEKTIACFWARVNKTPTCWLWTGFLDKDGYGRYMHYRAHRLSLILVIGAIADGMEVDHICRVRGCVNPEHLRVVTHVENMRASRGFRFKPYCVHGHARSPENLYVTFVRGRKLTTCRVCNREMARRLRVTKRPNGADGGAQ